MNNLNQRMVWYSLLILAGLVLVILSGVGKIDSFWAGMGGALAAVGILRMLQIARYKKDESYAEKVAVSNGDERNRYLAEKARSFAFYYGILAECIGLIVLRVLGFSELSTLLGLVACAQLIIYWISWLVLRKRY